MYLHKTQEKINVYKYRQSYKCSSIIYHGNNNFAKISKNLDAKLKMIMLDH